MERVIDRKNLPSKIPITGGVCLALGLDRVHAPAWVWGVFGTLWVILVILAIARIVMTRSVDIFESRPLK